MRQKHRTRICCFHCLRFDLSINKVSAYIRCIRCLRICDTKDYSIPLLIWCCWNRTAYVVYVCDNLQNGAIWWHGGDELLNKVIISVFFVHTKYSRGFVRLRLNHWCHLDYFTNLIAMFLSLDCVNYIAVYGKDRELSEFIKNILICFSKDERRSYRFWTTWGWVINARFFGWTIPLRSKAVL